MGTSHGICTALLALACLIAAAEAKAAGPKIGIPCFGSETIDYRHSGKPSVKVRLGSPVTVAVAPEPMGWGFYQFPGITRWDDGTLFVSYSKAPDSIKSYGVGDSGSMVSRDGGKTWSAPTSKHGISGLLLPNGDRMVVTTPKAIPISELKLPKPVGTSSDTYSKVDQLLYRLHELPEELQTVRLNRMTKGSMEWKPEQAKLIDPLALRYSLHGLFPIVWWGDVRVAPDGSLIAGVYPGFMMKDDGTADPMDHTFFYRSTDNGHTWEIQGRILYQPDMKADPKGDKRMGFTEPAYEILADGSFVCVLRTTDGQGLGPMYYSRSTDMGKTWTKPKAFTENGVLPKLLRLENGVLVLSSGRPGVQVRFSTDGKGESWKEPFEMVRRDGNSASFGADSCGYTSLIATGPDTFIIAYSDFKHKTGNGPRKAILIREIKVQKTQ